MVIQQIPVFDPNPSLRSSLKLLRECGITNFALIGRIATWLYLPSDRQQFTKDVDFAILTQDSSKMEETLKQQGLKVHLLPIGGVAVRESDLIVDFIDRRLDGFDLLFREAIENARRDIEMFGEIVPVVSLQYLITMKLVSGEPKDDLDVKTLLLAEKIDYDGLRVLVKKYLGPVTANRLDVFAREVGILPPRGPYKWDDVSS
ncbi:MAG: hypothetical protein HQM11_20200 [SAR324 cluster bacterium]|nr:hypothetical protein [SAR324 cluster bacterium]